MRRRLFGWLGLLAFEDEGRTVFRNVGSHSRTETSSHPTRRELNPLQLLTSLGSVLRQQNWDLPDFQIVHMAALRFGNRWSVFFVLTSFVFCTVNAVMQPQLLR